MPKSIYRNKLFLIIICQLIVLTATFLSVHNVYAADSSENIVETTFFGNLKDDGKGCGVYTVLSLVIDIFSAGVGILGVIGITISGTLYLTAKDNEQQVAKAKRRIVEIVLGLALYAVLYLFIQWLLPGGKLNTGQKCETVSDAKLEEIREAEKKAREEAAKNNTNGISGKPNSSSKPDSDVTAGEKIAQAAEAISWPSGTNRSVYHHDYPRTTSFKKWSDLKRAVPNAAFQKAYDKVRKGHGFKTWSAMGADCGVFVVTVLRYSGHDKKMAYGRAEGYYGSSKKWKKVTKAQRGDVCTMHTNSGTGFHTRIYLGKGKVAEANYMGQNFGHIVKGNCNGYNIWRPI